MAGEMPPPEVPEEGAEGGEGAAEVFVQGNEFVARAAQMVRSNPKIPDDIKSQFQAAAEAYRAGLEAITEFAGGGSEPMGGVVSVEQGGSRGAIPVTPAGVR